MPPEPYALKIIYSGTTVYFWPEEVNEVTLQYEQDAQVHIRQDANPEVFYIDSSFHELSITFDITNYDTESRLNTLLDSFVELQIYKAYKFDTSLNKKFVPNIDGIEEIEQFGYYVRHTKTITFLEST